MRYQVEPIRQGKQPNKRRRPPRAAVKEGRRRKLERAKALAALRGMNGGYIPLADEPGIPPPHRESSGLGQSGEVLTIIIGGMLVGFLAHLIFTAAAGRCLP